MTPPRLLTLSLVSLCALPLGCRVRSFAKAPAASEAKDYVPYRSRPGFEGFAVVTKPTATTAPEVIFRSLQRDGLPRIEKHLHKIMPDVFKGVFWRVEPLGNRMSDFILVPIEEMNMGNDRAAEIAKIIQNLEIAHVTEVVPLFTSSAEASTKELEAAEALNVEGLGDLSTADSEWNLKRTRTLAAHAFIKEKLGQDPGQSVVVGVIDTGTSDNPELIGTPQNPNRNLREDLGYNFIQRDKDVRNDMRLWGPLQNPNHGTSTASMIISQPGKQNSAEKRDVWVTGSAWGAQLIPTKVSNSVVMAVGWRFAAAMGHLLDKEARVISISMGGVPTPVMRNAVTSAVNEGAILVAAAGTGVPFVIHPARYDEVVSVASVSIDCTLDPQSAHGDRIDVSAPGTSAWIAWTLANATGGGFVHTTKQAWGTSLATPQVSGAAVLWVQYHGWENIVKRYGKKNVYKVFKHVLAASADKSGKCGQLPGSGYGAGMLDTLALLNQPLPDPSTIQ